VIALLRFWKPLAGVVLLAAITAAVWGYGRSKYTDGYQQAEAENAKALADWQIKYDAQVKADEKRITSARHAHEVELANLAARYDKPRPRLVCRAASRPSDVPAASGISETEAAEAGALRGAAEEGFDPTFRLFQLAEEADYMLANCRHLNQAVHGVPSE
jgi:hypothetical protein